MERELGQLLTPLPSILPEALDTTPPKANQQNQGGHLIDRMQGIGFLSVIEFANGKPKISISRALTVDLAYEQKVSSGDKNTATDSGSSVVRFGEVLRHSLCKEAPLRAWCDESRSYEAVIQRKIATGLPSLLSLSCCCAGRKGDDGLQIWQQEEGLNWLPEYISIRIETDRSVTVRELVTMDDGKEEWMTFEQKLPFAEDFFDAEKDLPQDLPIHKEYRLDAVVSFIRTHSGDSESLQSHSCEGHHVVHVRRPIDLEINTLEKQLDQINNCLAEKEASSTLVSGVPLSERREHLVEQLGKLKDESPPDDQWLLINGFVVTKLDSADDVRSFNAKFKEP